MTTKELYAKALNLVRVSQIIWIAIVLGFGLYAAVELPWWTLLIIPIAAHVLYHLMIMAIGIYIGSVAEFDQIKECRDILAAEELNEQNQVEPAEDADECLSLGDITSTGSHIGNFGDRKIYEWIEVQCKSGLHKFIYDRGAPLQQGEYINVSDIKDDEACYLGVIYKKSTT